ncbi:MAG: hypothetical protein HKO65_10285 [Gemmatimonadetes bacterium]|nr:hypothetical protein [Gemmatimonadota bacterium]NNM05480.1 hypothetical protein [Gemmatimonadota bacterium]
MITKRTSRLLLFPMTFLVFSCGKNLPPPINVVPQDQVYYSDESRLTEVTEMVIRNEATWRQMWDQLTGGQSDPPAVDFNSRMLLMVNGGRMDPGDRIQIDRLEHRGEELVVMYRVIESSGALESDVFPVQVVAVRRRAGQARFEVQRVRAPRFR